MGVTSDLARFVVETDYKDMPPEAIMASKQALLDGLGCALAGSADVAGKIASDYARSLGGNQEAGIIGSGFAAPAPEAAMVNGTMAHALDYDDVCRDWNGHPTVVLLPVLLALGEKHRLSGKQALAAYVLGVEIGGRIGAQFFEGHYKRGFHSTATLGALAAAAAASKLLGLDLHRTVMALGIAGSMAAGLRLNFGTMTKPFHAGNAARNGIVSAMLAQRGFTADENIIDGSYGYCDALAGEGEIAYAKMGQGLGQPFEVIKPGLAMKPYPCCRAAHRCIDGMLALVGSRDRFTAEDVDAVECVTSDWLPRVLIHVEPKDGLQGKFSMQYLMARAILDGAIRLAHFTDEKVLDPKAQALMRKVKFVHTPDRLGYAGRRLAEIVRVKLRGGRDLERAVGAAKGDPSNPMSKDELVGKYRDCAEAALPPSDIERSLEMVLNLEGLEDVGDLSRVVSRIRAVAG